MKYRSLGLIGLVTSFVSVSVTANDIPGLSQHNYNSAPVYAQTGSTASAGTPASREAADIAQRGQQSTGQNCITDLAAHKSTNKPADLKVTDEVKQCAILETLADGDLRPIKSKETAIQSQDKKIQCIKRENYTMDYKACEQAVQYYNYVTIAEAAMDLQQKVRTDLKNQNIQKEANQKVVAGDAQTGMFDAAIESNNHQKNMQQEKMVAYGAAVTALVAAYRMIPDKDVVVKECSGRSLKTPLANIDKNAECAKAIEVNRTSILANQDAKANLAVAIGTFTAKALAAGIAMGQYKNAANQIAAAKKPFEEEGQDLMMERCVFNPTDPACAKAPSVRTPGQIVNAGGFGVDDIGNNVFGPDLPTDPTTDPTLDPIKDGGEPVASVNSPFVDEAQKAKDIINPAGAAQMQPGSAPGGGSGGGGAGGGGGGSAQVGQDLNGVDKDANKEASIKANSLSGNYSAAGGGGYRGVSGMKDDKNPFSSLFDAKSDGGIEEESIAAGDIDGAASGLFQKISKRYGQIQADKRIEAKNLE